MKTRHDIDDNEFRNLYINKKLSYNDLAKLYGVSVCTISEKIKDLNITPRPPTIAHERIALTNVQDEVLTGALLGDGGIEKIYDGNTKLRYRSKHEEATQYIGGFFKNFWPDTDTKGFHQQTIIDKRSGTKSVSCTFKTARNPIFTELRHRWYPDGIKIVPRDIKLTPLTTLIWYLGDGQLHTHRGKSGRIHNQELKLHVQGFDVSDVEFLMGQLETFEPTLYMKLYKKSGKKLPIIVIYKRENVKEFLEYIGPCPLDCLQHRWAFVPRIEYEQQSCMNSTCNKRFIPVRHNQIYCTNGCRQADYNKQKRDKYWADKPLCFR